MFLVNFISYTTNTIFNTTVEYLLGRRINAHINFSLNEALNGTEEENRKYSILRGQTLVGMMSTIHTAYIYELVVRSRKGNRDPGKALTDKKIAAIFKAMETKVSLAYREYEKCYEDIVLTTKTDLHGCRMDYMVAEVSNGTYQINTKLYTEETAKENKFTVIRLTEDMENRIGDNPQESIPYLLEIAPQQETKNIREILNYKKKYAELKENAINGHTLMKGHKVALHIIAGLTKEISDQERVKEITDWAFENFNNQLEQFENSCGEVDISNVLSNLESIQSN
jgi:hypothetical protein